MLVITRKEGQKVHIGNDIVVTVFGTEFGRVKLGFEAPDSVKILRNEIWESGQSVIAKSTATPNAQSGTDAGISKANGCPSESVPPWEG